MASEKGVRASSVYVGGAFLTIAIIGTFLKGGSLIQASLFFTAALGLCVTAIANKQKMFASLQTVAAVGAFIPIAGIPATAAYAFLGGTGLAAMFYLIKTGYIKEDKWWPIGGLGLLTLAFSFATNGTASPILFNILLAAAGVLIAVYSAIGFFCLKVKIAAIWLVLNLVFCIKPLTNVLLHVL